MPDGDSFCRCNDFMLISSLCIETSADTEIMILEQRPGVSFTETCVMIPRLDDSHDDLELSLNITDDNLHETILSCCFVSSLHS